MASTISIHAPTRGATKVSVHISNLLVNFNPRSHERSDYTHSFFLGLHNISIHAPTRGATYFLSSKNVCEYISIHAPTRGATRSSYNRGYCRAISIHAPTRGATSWTVLYPILILFQSTLPREERPKSVFMYT